MQNLLSKLKKDPVQAANSDGSDSNATAAAQSQQGSAAKVIENQSPSSTEQPEESGFDDKLSNQGFKGKKKKRNVQMETDEKGPPRSNTNTSAGSGDKDKDEANLLSEEEMESISRNETSHVVSSDGSGPEEALPPGQENHTESGQRDIYSVMDIKKILASSANSDTGPLLVNPKEFATDEERVEEFERIYGKMKKNNTSKTNVDHGEPPTPDNLYEALQSNFLKSVSKAYLYRLVLIGTHSEEQEPLIDWLKELVDDINVHCYSEIITGVLVLYPNHFIHVLEGSEDTLLKFMKTSADQFEPTGLDWKLEFRPGKGVKVREPILFTSVKTVVLGIFGIKHMMEDADTKHRIKFSWLYEKEKQHGERQKAALALPSIEKQAELYDKPFEVDTWGYRNQNYIMYVPNGVAFTPEEEVQMAKRKTEVIYNNTRFKEAPFKSDEVEASKNAAAAAGCKPPSNKIGVDGKELESDTPKVNGFGFCRTPSPTPGIEESPYMTWGEIEGSPFRLDGGDTPIPITDAKPYRMLGQTKRERIAMELTEKVSQRYRDKKLKAIEAARSHLSTPSPRPMSVMDRLSSMSPAAQKLARSKIGSSIVDKALRASYTPSRTPGSARSQLSTPTPKSLRTSKTPTLGRPHSTASASNITTDDLLNLPANRKSNRPSASDFF